MTTVLVIEDEANIRLFITANLKVRGYTIQEAATGAQALELMQIAPPQVIILDMLLPDMTGVDILHVMAGSAVLRTIPVALMTASVSTAEAEAYPNVVQRVVKPASVTTLLKAVEIALTST